MKMVTKRIFNIELRKAFIDNNVIFKGILIATL